MEGIFNQRSLTTDITPILICCNEEYTAIPGISYEDGSDNSKTAATSLFTTIDSCNRFIDTLKTAYKL